VKIGIIGSEGVVGNACKFGFELIGHKVLSHDLKLNTSLSDVIESDLIFVCVPTPSNPDGSCNVDIVESVILELDKLTQVRKTVAIKSTIVPGTTQRLQEMCSNLSLCFVPEFLKERSAILDFTERHDLCVIGCAQSSLFFDNYAYDLIKMAHGRLPKKFFKMTSTNAEFCKYFNNSFGAMLTVFANSFYEICEKYNADYSIIKEAMTNRNFISNEYLECNEKWRGYAGPCWTKDLPALNKIAEGTGVEFFKHIIEENEKYIKTVPGGMRMK